MIIETWRAQALRVDNSIVHFKIEEYEDEIYIWIYFAYAPTPREFRNLIEVFEKRYYGIIEFNTQKPRLFRNHSKRKENGIYEWIRVFT